MPAVQSTNVLAEIVCPECGSDAFRTAMASNRDELLVKFECTWMHGFVIKLVFLDNATYVAWE